MSLQIRKLKPGDFARAYGIRCQSLFPAKGGLQPGFGAVWGVVEPGEKTHDHNHYEGEVFVILDGRGVFACGGERAEVEPGDVVFVPPLDEHSLENSGRGDLQFLSFWWGDPELLAERRAELVRDDARRRPARTLITATPPTPNGDLHLGHLSGPYLGADIHRRYLDMHGVDAHYITGADDHQSYVDVKARALGVSAEDAARRFGDLMAGTLDDAAMSPDLFARPRRSPHHADLAREVFATLYEKGYIVEREAPSLHCAACDLDLFEAYVGGRCPHCRRPSYGNACEDCGRPNDCVDLIDPRCNLCGGPPTVRTGPRLYLRLDRCEDAVREAVGRTRMSPHLRALCDRMIGDGLPEISVSHVADWGLGIPLPGFESQRMYVWFEMAAGYLAATRELGQEDLWRSNDADIVQFFGFDNGYFHAILFPAIFHAYDPEIRTAQTFVVNEFYRLDGRKFSTSSDHAVWGRDFLAEYSADVTRFFLAYSGPEREQSNFTMSRFRETLDGELLGRWQPWLAGLRARVADACGGRAPEPGAWSEEHAVFFDALGRLIGEAERSYEVESFSPAGATRVLSELVRRARRFGRSEEAWRESPRGADRYRTGLCLELAAARTLAMIAAPLMPGFSAALGRALGYDDASMPGRSWSRTPAFVPAGARVGALDESLVATAPDRVAAATG